jgi:hypothetical protein
MVSLAEDVKLYPDSYQYEWAKRLNISKTCVLNALRRLGITYKKSLNHAKALESDKEQFPDKINKYQ